MNRIFQLGILPGCILLSCLASRGNAQGLLANYCGPECVACEQEQSVDEDDLLHQNASYCIACADEGCAGCECCACYCPRWAFTAGALTMERTRNRSIVLIEGVADPTQNLNADDFDFGFETGFELAGRKQSDCHAWEVRFMMIDGWDANTSALNGASADALINTNPPFTLPNATGMDADYASDLLSVEANHYWLRGDLTFLAGFRFAQIDEAFAAATDTGAQISTYNIATDNRLYGGQIGTEAILYCDACWELDATAKAGLYYNDSQQRSRIDTGIVQFNAAGNDEELAFLGELSLAVRRNISCQCQLVLRYDLLWTESIAVATDQTRESNFILGTGHDNDGDIFYHGSFVGFQLYY